MKKFLNSVFFWIIFLFLGLTITDIIARYTILPDSRFSLLPNIISGIFGGIFFYYMRKAFIKMKNDKEKKNPIQ